MCFLRNTNSHLLPQTFLPSPSSTTVLLPTTASGACSTKVKHEISVLKQQAFIAFQPGVGWRRTCGMKSSHLSVGCRSGKGGKHEANFGRKKENLKFSKMMNTLTFCLNSCSSSLVNESALAIRGIRFTCATPMGTPHRAFSHHQQGRIDFNTVY